MFFLTPCESVVILSCGSCYYEDAMVANYPSWLPPKLVEHLAAWRQSRKLILFVVFVALFLDNMLLTTLGQHFFLRTVCYFCART